MITGYFFDGKTSKKHACSMRIDSDGNVYLDGVSISIFHWSDMRIPSRVGNTARILRLPEGALFETTCNNEVDQINSQFKKQQHLFDPHSWESKLKYVFASVILSVLVLWGLFTIGLPTASKYVALSLPAEVSKSLSDGTLKSLDNLHFSASEIAIEKQKALRALFKKYVPDDDFNYRLLFRKSEVIGANAFALPDGTVIVTDELLLMMDDQKEVLSILLHELGHVKYRHSLRMAIQSTGLWVVYSWMTGDLAATSTVIVAIPAILMQTHFSRELEREADGYSLSVMLDKGINPRVFSSAMARLESYHRNKHKGDALEDDHESKADSSMDKIIPYLSTHPSSADRMERFNKAGESFELEASKH